MAADVEHRAQQQGATSCSEAKEFAHLLDLADVVDIPTAAEGYMGQQEREEATGNYLNKNTHALAQTLYETQVPVVLNDLILEVERIRRRKNQSPPVSQMAPMERPSYKDKSREKN